MFRFMSDMFEFTKKRSVERAAAAEKARIAKVFNDCYTYRNRYITSHAWMCPLCNRVHDATEHSFLTGMQYPACCTYPEGPRCLEGIKDK